MAFNIRSRLAALLRQNRIPAANNSGKQHLDLYWDPQMAEALETWGDGNAWSEIQLLLATCHGKVLDIACGPGKVIEILSKFPELEVYGCDISDFFIERAIARGLNRDLLRVCNATDTQYEHNAFDYSYSIGSLEHFQEEDILAFLKEAKRITKRASLHQIPIAKGNDEGWITPYQSYFNNSVEWWLPKFRLVFPEVIVLPSNWSDDRSVGQWFICSCRNPNDAGHDAMRILTK